MADIYVADPHIDAIYVFDGALGSDGFSDFFVTPGAGGLVRPTGLIFGPPGNPYGPPNLYVVSTPFSGQDRIYMFDNHGNFFKILTTGSDFGGDLAFEPN